MPARFPRAVLLSGLLALAPAAAAEDGKVSTEKVAYKGWAHCLRVSNGKAELIATLDVGPRIISYRLLDGKNVFKQYGEQLGKSGEAEWQIRGGHRLWTAPEDLTRTYALDNSPAESERGSDGWVILRWPEDGENRIRKEIHVGLEPGGSRVQVVHFIKNTGKEPTELAPWALTVMAPGGVEIVPMPPRKPHPGSPKNARSPADFAADRTFTLWPYFDFTDDRWHLGSRFILLRQDARKGATKIGMANREGWAAYLNDGTLFVKRFGHEDGEAYPDFGANYETFTNEDMLEMETLGPLVKLAPGATVEHRETWELFPGVAPVRTEADAERIILPLVGKKSGASIRPGRG